MVCPKCGNKARVIDNSHNLEQRETYRELKCTKCSHIFYTVEMDVEVNSAFKNSWFRYHRDRKRGKNEKSY